MKLLTTLLLAVICITGFSQRVSHCTLYNEHRAYFTVYLNGERKNDVPSDRVRIINLDQPYYRLKIEFQDISIPPVEKDFFSLVDEYGNPVDVIYSLTKNKKGIYSLTWKSQRIFPDYINGDNPVVSVSGGWPIMGIDSISEATSKSISSAASSSGVTKTNTACPGTVLNQGEFNEAVRAMASRGTEEGRYLMAKQFVTNNCVSVIQVKNILKMLASDDKKLDVAKNAYVNTVDKGYYFRLQEEFLSEASFDDLNRAILK